MIVIRVSVSFCTDAFHFWLVDEVSMLIDGSIATEWCNWICTKFHLEKKNSQSLRSWERKSTILSRKSAEKCVFNERFAVNSTINHFYLFYDLLISLLWSGQSSTLPINYTHEGEWQRAHIRYVLFRFTMWYSSGVLLQKSNKRSNKTVRLLVFFSVRLVPSGKLLPCLYFL